ncbi:hypothetical protein R3P38DRAFT_2852636 [Favolaschia claudopus]|uniref:Uncharacterized protein n=1 Tax=Favolaschia claudopus TaxID=2862362 RepID=A0AAW0DPN1_9AGAR
MWKSNNYYSQRCVAEVLQVASRWRSVHFGLELPNFFIRELEGMGPLSFLEELEMPEFMPDDLKFDPTSISCFSTASKLRKLTMESNCPIVMPWTQLTDITLLSDSISPDAALDILSQCTHLVRASVTSPPWYDVAPTRSMVQLDYLRSLEIRFTDTALHNIWDYLSAPVLDDLGLTIFTAFQLRSPNITKLKIHAPFPPEALKTIFLHSVSPALA